MACRASYINISQSNNIDWLMPDTAGATPAGSEVPGEYLALTDLDFTILRCGIAPAALEMIAAELAASADRLRAAGLAMGGRA